MSLLVAGSIALDSVETPTSRRDNVLGGSAVFFSYAARFFSEVKLLGGVGEDWPAEHTRMLRDRGIDTSGLQVVRGSKTFRWRGKYLPNMNDRETLEVQLNVLETYEPLLSPELRQSKFVFLANGAPSLQLRVLDQLESPLLVVADTMDLWINLQHDDVLRVLRRIDGLVLNDSEAKLLAHDENLVRAGQAVRELGPKFVIIKKGEHGAMYFGEHETFVLPAFPTSDVVDPTGAGDTFAGAMMGYLSEQHNLQPATIKQAMAYGIVVASFTVEDFSLDRLQKITRGEIDRRLAEYHRMMSF